MKRKAESEASEPEFDDVHCEVCSRGDDSQNMLLCDKCDKGYHLKCINLKKVPKEDWFCEACTVRTRGSSVGLLEQYTEQERAGVLETCRNNYKFYSIMSFCRGFRSVLKLPHFTELDLELAIIRPVPSPLLRELVARLVSEGPADKDHQIEDPEAALQKYLLYLHRPVLFPANPLNEGARLDEATPGLRVNMLHALAEWKLQEDEFCHSAAAEEVEGLDLHGTTVGTDSCGWVYYHDGGTSPRLYRGRWPDPKLPKTFKQFVKSYVSLGILRSTVDDEDVWDDEGRMIVEEWSEPSQWETVSVSLEELDEFAAELGRIKALREKELHKALVSKVLGPIKVAAQESKAAEERAMERERKKLEWERKQAEYAMLPRRRSSRQVESEIKKSEEEEEEQRRLLERANRVARAREAQKAAVVAASARTPDEQRTYREGLVGRTLHVYFDGNEEWFKASVLDVRLDARESHKWAIIKFADGTFEQIVPTKELIEWGPAVEGRPASNGVLGEGLWAQAWAETADGPWIEFGGVGEARSRRRGLPGDGGLAAGEEGWAPGGAGPAWSGGGGGDSSQLDVGGRYIANGGAAVRGG